MNTRYLSHQLAVVSPYLNRAHTVLDFGCGDLSFAVALVKRFSAMRITGIDVVESVHIKHERVVFQKYDGVHIPFSKNSFDAVISYHVFHHCDNPAYALAECARVAKKRLIIVEPVMRGWWDKPGFMLFDILANAGRGVTINMPFHVHSRSWWISQARKLHIKVIKELSGGVLPEFLPIGKTVCFIMEK